MSLAGNMMAPVLIMGEAPGSDEDNCGIPFVGKSGRLLRDALKTAGCTDFAVANVCRCRPPSNRPPTQEEADACIHHTWEDIARMPNLKLIVAVGNVALRTLTGKQGITKVSGEEWKWSHDPVAGGDENTIRHFKLMPLMHPSYILQNQGRELDRFFDHVARIPRIVSGDLTTEDDFGEYIVIKDITQWRVLTAQLYGCKIFAYDTETTGLVPWDEGAHIKCIQFSFDPKVAYILPLNSWDHCTEWPLICGDLKDIFEDKKIGKIGQNIKFDNLWMKVTQDIDVKGTVWDTKIAEYLLLGKGSTGLKDMAWRYSRMGGFEKRLPDSPEKLEGADLDELYHYGGIDADLTFRAYNQQVPRLKKQDGVYHLFKTLLVPVSNVLMNMEYHGIRMDMDRVKESDKECEKLVERLKKQMYQLPEVKEFERAEEKEFNPNSHQQVAYILYKISGLDVFKKTEKAQKPATDKEVLERYASRSKLCELLLEYSSYEQMHKTFLAELLAHERQGRIHTTLWLTETATGRTSSKKPNMQNMPKGEKDILEVRKAFLADPGFLLCEPDLNQHELRVMAEVANDAAMKEALRGDIHKATGAAIFGIPPEQITDDQRREAKTVNFGIIYGLSKYGLAQQLGIEETEAELWLFRFFEKYYMTKRYMEETSAFCKKYGYVEALSGRRRYFPSWEEFDNRKLKEVINFPIQATASDILLYGAVFVDRLLKGRKSFLILEVHDSLLLNLHKSEIGLIDEIKEGMCNYFRQFMPFDSPLKVDISCGENWGEMEKWT